MQSCLLVCSIFIYYANGMTIHRPWNNKHWCESIEKPEWPFAYQKQTDQTVEYKGRTASSLQDNRHQCGSRGGKSKCHICEDIPCGVGLTDTCSYQIQGIPWNLLTKNIPTVTDVPFAVNGRHRYDYTGGTHVCLFQSGNDCIRHDKDDYGHCTVRCWGVGSGNITTKVVPAYDDEDTDKWDYEDYKQAIGYTSGSPQGWVGNVAGVGIPGYLDGPSEIAQFWNPQDLTVDRDRNVYVVDTNNHCIRKIDGVTKIVSTVAGTGAEGFLDGAANQATFSFPSGIVAHQVGGALTLYVADTGNHRIRKIQNGIVSCFSGRCGAGTETRTISESQALPQPGFADGDADTARFHSPRGLDITGGGTLFVADTGNKVVRRVLPNGDASVLAGNLRQAEATSGCPPPCLEGVPGFRDGNLTYARFLRPVDVTVGLDNTVVVTDDNRIRRISDSTMTSTIQGVTSLNRVVTLAGSYRQGLLDGSGHDARFYGPSGIAMSSDGELYIASPVACKIRRIAPAIMVAETVTCNTKATDIIRPSGCSSYDKPVDSLRFKSTSSSNNIYYNFLNRSTIDPIRGVDFIGRKVKHCVGTVPPATLTNGSLSIEHRDASGNQIFKINEDTGDGTTIKVQCPAGCASASYDLFGSRLYADNSHICAAALHDGAIDDSGGLVTITLQLESIQNNLNYSQGNISNGISSKPIPFGVTRLFSVSTYEEANVGVQTIAGHASASLSDACGYENGYPPQAALFSSPSGVALHKATSLSDSEYLYIADSKNNRIRIMTATCSRPCENGASCVASEVCACKPGWSGNDCSIPECTGGCGNRKICVAPEVCSCIPGYTGDQCDVPQCVQDCQHGGVCASPDTCDCSPGWFDPNCTTPVCDQTCGNGGNCTMPSTCSCPSEWTGNDCRTPVCSQTCKNGGACIAPDTCQCPAGWSGHDCDMPICSQGMFIPDPSTYHKATTRPRTWDQYVPCELPLWCRSVNGIDCAQKRRHFTDLSVKWGAEARKITGIISKPYNCLRLEITKEAITHFQYENEAANVTAYNRYSPITQYRYNAMEKPWRGILDPEIGFLPPWSYDTDRQLALAERKRVVQGVYGCANGGNCTAPDVCQCSKGWAGFDCRTPICSQGYYVPTQAKFIATEPEEAIHARHPISNPQYSLTEEILTSNSITRNQISHGPDLRYIGPNGVPQGGYSCSIRSLTEWEKPETFGTTGTAKYYHNHPNYYSRYMDTSVSSDGFTYTHWTDMFWPPVYSLSTPLLDRTRKGWERRGTWLVDSRYEWQKGKCLLEFNRTCPQMPEKAYDLVSQSSQRVVVDTDISYRTRVIYSDATANATGRWYEKGGECVDVVLRGCFNNGTCIAPDTCQCEQGWSGNDCSIPLCENECLNNGNCTLPNTCTCALGWTGSDCSVPLCAQECRNGGKCVAPDTCECNTWPSEWRDGREGGGRPVYRKPNGDPQDTGYTGYDCTIPICTQAEKFLLNVPRSHTNFATLRGHGSDGKMQCSLERCPLFDEEVISNDGNSFQAGCRVGNLVPQRSSSLSRTEQLNNLRNSADIRNVNRSSEELCGNLVWEQGDYTMGRHIRTNYHEYQKITIEEWREVPATPGEGVYQCYNRGSCIAPDVCTCGDGYEGVDCNLPSCRFLQANGSVVGCQHNSVCTDRDECTCIHADSILHQRFDDAPLGNTGWTGSDCSIAMCIQGYFDPLCTESNAGIDGCYRCPNNGLCVAPDLCECAPGWSGYNCKTPVCRAEVDSLVRYQLNTYDESKVHAFELDPCGTAGIQFGTEIINNMEMGHGNCTLPGLCTCLCRQRFDYDRCQETGELCERAWHDPLQRSLPPGYIYGTKNCFDGFQGMEHEDGRMKSCHLQIYVPAFYERYTASFLTIFIIGTLTTVISWRMSHLNRRRRQIMASAYQNKKFEQEDKLLQEEMEAFEYE